MLAIMRLRFMFMLRLFEACLIVGVLCGRGWPRCIPVRLRLFWAALLAIYVEGDDDGSEGPEGHRELVGVEEVVEEAVDIIGE